MDAKAEIRTNTCVWGASEREDGRWDVEYTESEDAGSASPGNARKGGEAQEAEDKAREREDQAQHVLPTATSRNAASQGVRVRGALPRPETFDAVVVASPLENAPFQIRFRDARMQTLISEYCSKRRMHTTYATFVR
jgi:hypothetical protein